MNGKECKAYKEWGCWKEELCKWCIHPSCKERKFDYDLAGNRWSLTCGGRAGAKRATKVGVGVNYYKITHILWSKKSIGLGLKALGREFVVTVKDKAGEFLHPGVFKIEKDKALEKYKLETINNRGLQGVWIPLVDLKDLEVKGGINNNTDVRGKEPDGVSGQHKEVHEPGQG